MARITDGNFSIIFGQKVAHKGFSYPIDRNSRLVRPPAEIEGAAAGGINIFTWRRHNTSARTSCVWSRVCVL